MKLKKIMAGILAGAMVVSSMALTAFADATVEVKYTGGTGADASYEYTVQTDVTSVSVAIKYADAVDEGKTFGFNDWCGNGIVVEDTDGTKTYYGFGGSQVSWNGSIYEKDDSLVPAAGDDKYFTLTDGEGSFDLAVAGAGTKISFYALGWDSYDGTQYTVTITGDAEPEAADSTSGDVLPFAVIALSLSALAAGAVVVTKKVSFQR